MLADFAVELVNDNINEFIVDFVGPKDSEPPRRRSCLLPRQHHPSPSHASANARSAGPASSACISSSAVSVPSPRPSAWSP